MRSLPARDRIDGRTVVKRLACLVLLLGLVVPLAPPAHAARSLGASPGNTVAREPVTISATVPGRARRPVVLQRKQGNRWVAIARKRTSPRGKVAFRVATTAMTVRVQAPRTRVGGKRLAAWTSLPRRIDPRVPRSFVVGRAAVGGRAGRTSEFGAEEASISADGRYVAFSSFSSDLVAGDANGHGDVFVADLRTGDVQMISFRNTVGDANGDSFEPSISPDGGSVAFTTAASTLFAVDGNSALDVLVWDRSSGDLELVSAGTGGGQSNGDSYDPSIAEFGNVVVFTSTADNLFAGDANAASDVFVRARGVNQTILQSRTGAGQPGNDVSNEPVVSRDGRWVAFSTAATDIVAGDTNGEYDVVRRPLFTAGPPRLIGRGNAGSSEASISADGARVAFTSTATDLVAADTNTRPDVYLWDAATGRQTLVSASPGGAVGDDASSNPALSPDGRFVAFQSYAGNLAPGDGNGILDVFTRNLGARVTSLVSVLEDGSVPAQESRNPAISGNGDLVAYESGVTAFAFDDDNAFDDVFVCRRRSLRGMS